MQIYKVNIQKKAIKRFSEVFREDALKDYEVCEILGISHSSLSTLKRINKKANKTLSVKSVLITRLIKNLHPSIIKFMLNDIYFDDRFRIKKDILDKIKNSNF